MAELKEPKLGTTANMHRSIVKTFTDVCNGITIMLLYGILWMLIGLLGYGLYNWIM
jgi:hypothetical protein